MTKRQHRAINRNRRVRKAINIRRNNVPNSEKKNVEITPTWAMKAPKMPKHWKGHADPNHDVIIRKVKKGVEDEQNSNS